MAGAAKRIRRAGVVASRRAADAARREHQARQAAESEARRAEEARNPAPRRLPSGASALLLLAAMGAMGGAY